MAAMALPHLLARYVGARFLASFAAVLAGLLAVVFLADLTEMLRRAAEDESARFGIVLAMTLLRLPGLSEKLLPVAVLLAASWSLLRLERGRELVIARAAGLSAWQLLATPLAAAVVIGAVSVTLYNPFAAAMAKRYEQLEARHLKDRPTLIALSRSGLWLRQAEGEGEDRDQAVIHALRLGPPAAGEWLRLEKVIVFLYQETDRFTGRIDAESAILRNGHWELRAAWVSDPQGRTVPQAILRLPTRLTPERIAESFASPETLSVWSLPDFARTLEAAGVSARRHWLHWYHLLAQPLLLAAMIELAALFALHGPMRGSLRGGLVGAALAGFLLYALSDTALALGQAGALPPLLAAWLPAGLCVLLATSLLLHFEDG